METSDKLSIIRRKIMGSDLSATDEMLLLRALRKKQPWDDKDLQAALSSKGKAVAATL